MSFKEGIASNGLEGIGIVPSVNGPPATDLTIIDCLIWLLPPFGVRLLLRGIKLLGNKQQEEEDDIEVEG